MTIKIFTSSQKTLNKKTPLHAGLGSKQENF